VTAKPVSSFFGDIESLLEGGDPPRMALVPGSRDWTEEQWAEHDAKVAEKLAAQKLADAAQERASRIGSFEKAGWPKRALEAAASADPTKPALARIAAWKADHECVLVLSGAPGCGKTTAAAHWALKRTWPPAFLRATTFAASSRYDHARRSAWLEAEALVLDDLGAEYADAKGNFLVDLDELVDTFYGDKRPLVITTNCTDADFKSRYGQRVVDRIRECGSWFSVNSASLRKKAG
jgi:DNA replication protein DnaC